MSRSGEPGRTGLAGGLEPLRYKNYLLFWIGAAASNTGRWIELTGAIWLVYELTSSPVLLGLLGVARAIPALIVSPLAGVFADRLDQRRALFATQAVALTLSLILGLLVATGTVEIWHVYAQVVLQTAVQNVDSALRQTLFPRLVPRANLPEAVALTSTAGRSAALVGPALGGLALAAYGDATPFFLNAATFLVLMAALAYMRNIIPMPRATRQSFGAELREGVGHILGAPIIAGLIVLDIAFNALQMNPVIIAIVAREVLHVGPTELGALLSAPALGAVVGLALLLSLGFIRRQGRFVVLCTLAYCGALVAFAASGTYALSFAALALTGLFDALSTVTRHSIVQLAVPGRMRGRVMANMGTVTRGVGPLSQTQSGLLAEVFGPPMAVVGAAVVLAAVAASAPQRIPALWNFTRDDGDWADDPTAGL